MINPTNAQLNPICHLLALLGTHHIVHVSRIRVNTDRQASHKAAGHRSRYFFRLQLEHKAATHCSRDKHLARPLINQKK